MTESEALDPQGWREAESEALDPQGWREAESEALDPRGWRDAESEAHDVSKCKLIFCGEVLARMQCSSILES